jgi:ATP-dependent helicase HrpB
MLEPRRLAARAAAERMAQTLGEPVGKTVGYRMRGASKVSPDTRIQVVTEGILTRMMQDQPDLAGVGAVIFDEFHERSLNADLGLALCLDIAGALRDDLMIVAMSATLDAAPVAQIMQSPVITSEGRSFAVAPRWLDRPTPKTTRFEQAVCDLILHALSHSPGSLLAFLPGEAEIRRTQALLAHSVPSDCVISPLFGAMEFAAQRRAIDPAPPGQRKVVLATSIAETSLTIDGIAIVVDAGKSRRMQFDPASGMARLITARVTQAEATQRMGRAGRLSEGVCYKMWTRGEDGALAQFPPPQIESGDLCPLALELALWGADEKGLSFVTPPHPASLTESRALLQMLGASDAKGRITDHGRAMARVPAHPRLAHMIIKGGKSAGLLAALLNERDILRGAPADLQLRLDALRQPEASAPYFPHRATIARIKEDARRLQGLAGQTANDWSTAQMAAMAYPDRIALRRAGDAPRFVLSGGKGAYLKPDDPLGSARLLVVTDLDGDPREARIRQAIPITDADLRALFGAEIAWEKTCAWSRRTGRVRARTQERFGSLFLQDHAWYVAPPEQIALAMLDGIRQLGLTLTPSARRFLSRAGLIRHAVPDFPDFSEPHLMATLEDWLLPYLNGPRSAEDWKAFDITPALRARLSWEKQQQLDQMAPAVFETPLGRSIPIEYDGAVPKIELRLQEVFGVTRHPCVAGQPVQMTLLSPARRPVQITDDLPGFWASSYQDVRKDMRGRYPKHPWPEDPTQADPTLRAKPRGT